MLVKSFSSIYNKFRMNLYTKIFKQEDKSKDSLSAIDVLCVELIYALDRPTIKEFAEFAGLSAPNAAYKVNNLVKKGYIWKVQSEIDKREYHLEVTDKYASVYGITSQYVTGLTKKIEERFTREEIEKLEEILAIVDEELMAGGETITD